MTGKEQDAVLKLSDLVWGVAVDLENFEEDISRHRLTDSHLTKCYNMVEELKKLATNLEELANGKTEPE